MISIAVSTHPKDEDKFVRIILDGRVTVVPMCEWSYAMAHVERVSPSGQPIGPQDGGTPASAEAALMQMAA